MSSDHHAQTVDTIEDPTTVRHRTGWLKPAPKADLSVHVFTL